MTLAEQVELLMDEREISRLIYVYCRAVDRGDRELLQSLYHPDAKEEHGGYNGDLAGFVDYAFSMVDWAKEGLSHHITNILIDVQGDTAFAESAFMAMSARATDIEGNDIDIVIFGRYLDTFEKRSEAWKIAHRRVVFDSNHTFPASGLWTGPLHGNFVPKGKPNATDALYETMAKVMNSNKS